MSQSDTAKLFTTITWETEGSVAFICLNRPDKHNAINIEMMHELRIAIDRAAASPDIHVIVLAANGGKTFSSGIDLSAGILSPTAAMRQSMIKDYLPLAESMEGCNKLIIACIEGEVIGLACSLVMLCDQLYMSEEASFNLVFSDLGLVADGGANWLLPRKVGYSVGLQLVVEAEKLTADRCLALGIANRVLPANEIDEAVREMAKSLARRANLPQVYTKQLMRASTAGASLSEIIHQEADAQTVCVGSAYFQKAYTQLRKL